MVIVDFTPEELTDDRVRACYQYWLDKKGDRVMPSRADLNPAEIVPLLPHTLLIDVLKDPQRYRARLMGTEIVKVVESDYTGLYLEQLPRLERHLKGRFDWVVAQKKPYYYNEDMRWSSKAYMNNMGLVLPLSANGRDVDMFVMYMLYTYANEKPVAGAAGNKNSFTKGWDAGKTS